MGECVGGGCFCGHIRYEIRGKAKLQVLCFCTDCLKLTGTAGYAGYMVDEADFQLVAGKPSVHEKDSETGRKVVRHFCPDCGAPLYGVTEFGLISVAAGSLDDPEIFNPEEVVFTESAPHWGRLPG